MMRVRALRWLLLPAVLLSFAVALSGQEAIERGSSPDTSSQLAHMGYPQDWSSRYLLMPGTRAEDVLTGRVRDPRQIHSMMVRQLALDRSRVEIPRRRRKIHIDWSVSLENGYVPEDQFPAKFQFGIGAESCNSDYLLLGLTVTSGTQANIVGINNLYTTGGSPCNSGSPWVAFAYNTVTQTGGQIKTSPALSVDGTKVAFVESTSSGSYFHVLVLPNPIPAPPSHDGTVLSPLTPTSCTTPTTPGCMTTLTIETTATNSNSSPWIDYVADTAYVGADNGVLYKITPVFGGGAPALVTTGGWPVTVSTQTDSILTAAVEDIPSGRLFLGDGEGYLYAVSLSSPGGTYAAQVAIGWIGHGAGTGIIDPPMVVNDVANPTTDQVFSYTGCSTVQGIGGAITQFPATFTSSTTASTSNTVDLGSGSGDGDCTSDNLHAPTPDNAFWTNGSASGHMIGCGFVSGTNQNPLIPSNPKMYFFPFASNVITSTGDSTFVVNSTVGDECSPLTEFYDGTTDRLFFGVGGSTNGFLESSIITGSLATPNCASPPTSSCVTAPSALGGTSGIVIDNDLSNGGTNLYLSTLAVGSVNGQKCNVSGGSSNPYCAVKLTQSALQ